MLKQINNQQTEIISEISYLRKTIKNWKKENKIIGLVPTMGALHEGHESLIKKAKELCDVVVVSVFVNPIQFGPSEDLDKYPKQLAKDRELCSKHGVEAIFAPAPQEMYPGNNNLTLICPPEGLKNKLCGKTRIGHFDGVATVVFKLFNLVQPDKAFFGQKDAQQLIIINKMTKDLNLDIEIVRCPIIRESSGLALSSRNSYLSTEAKEKALSLSKVLNKIFELYSSGINSKEKAITEALNYIHPDIIIEYLDVYDIETLVPVETIKPNSLIAIAAKVENVRLIDNVII